MGNLRWGVVGTADIGMREVIPAIQSAARCEVVAIASRDSGRAAAAAGRLGVPKSYGSYDSLLADGDIDAVYLPLPNDAHAEWTVRAAAAGKHVLCEKPLALTSSQAGEMVAACASAGVKLAEAFMYRHHPTWVEVVRLLREGAIGRLQAVQSFFSYFNDDPANIRKAKKAIRTAFETQVHGLGFSMVELLSTCSTGWGVNPVQSLSWLEEHMIPAFPLGDYKIAPSVAALKF